VSLLRCGRKFSESKPGRSPGATWKVDGAVKSLGFEFSALRHCIMLNFDLEQYRLPLNKFACKLMRDPTDAEDLVQETLVKAWSLRNRIFIDRKPMAYLMTMMYHLFVNFSRKQARTVPTVSFRHDDIVGLDKAIDETFTKEVELRAELEELRSKTSQDDWRLFELLAQDYSYKEIGEVVGCVEGTVKSRLDSARRRAANNSPRTTAFRVVQL